MKISGNQTAVKEIMNLLDPNFIPPFMCKCYVSKGFAQSNVYAEERGLGRTHWCECPEEDKWYEANYREHFHSYEVEYDGNFISKCREILDSSDNILNGCVR